jgi:tRNA modification GTPase
MLCDYCRAIVSPIAGTTRDFIEAQAAIEGDRVKLVDTAGLRDARDPVEMEGIRRSREQMTDADLLILAIDGSLPLDGSDVELVQEFEHRRPLVALTKSDLPGGTDTPRWKETFPTLTVISLSTIDGRGRPELARAIADRCREGADDGGMTAPNLRHRGSLRAAAAAMGIAVELLSETQPLLDLVVTELRAAAGSLGEITGESADEEILDRVFSRFCLGK